MVETLRWRDGCLELLDQRLLPHTIDYRAYHDAGGVAEAIHSMVVRGAPAIGCAAAYGVALEAARLVKQGASDVPAALESAIATLAASRPTAVNLAWALDRMRRCIARHAKANTASMAQALLDEADGISREDLEINLRIGEFGAELIPHGARVLTHCNAGALATAGHGTALGVIRSAVAAGKHVSVVVDETRPWLQGARLTAWEMLQENIPATLIADVSAGYLMSRGEIDLVIVGADRVAANGDTANKIGTYSVAVLAQRHGIPFYVACPLSTVDRTLSNGAGIPIEERGSDEVTGYGGVRWAPLGIRTRNPAFDVTPAELITALITERGVVTPPEQDGIRRLFDSE